MSNSLAIATVTATLYRILLKAVKIVPGAGVTTEIPGENKKDTKTVGVNIYLYQVAPNGTWRNADLPTRSSDGQLMKRPQIALDLFYLLTFYGDATKLEPQRLLGSVVSTLHSQPILSREQIGKVIEAAQDPSNPVHPYLAQSDLTEQVELVRFSPLPLNLEELSKLWSVFFQTPYALSVAYQGSVVLIESQETSQKALPVRTRNLHTVPFRQPVIEQIKSQAGMNKPVVEDQFILTGYILIIAGRQLYADSTKVRIGGIVVQPPEAGENQISLPLTSPPFPADSLRAGVQAVQVIHELNIGTPADPHRGFDSNVAAFVLHPGIRKDVNGNYEITITSVQADAGNTKKAKVTVNLNPKVGRRQRVVLLMNEFQSGVHAYSFNSAPRASDTDTVEFQIIMVAPGVYLFRVQVDGAESPLDVDESTKQYIGPKVTIPS